MSEAHEQEGVTRFVLEHTEAQPLEAPAVDEVCAARDACVTLGVVGREDDRYDGYGFGNVSVRHADAFVITGTQTGGVARLRPEHVALVTEAHPEENRVRSEGPVAPSSESMTHAVVYAERPDVQAIIHGHHPGIWQRRAELGLPCTDAAVTYGTPEMAEAVAALVREGADAFAMDGHVDGFVTVGADVPSAMTALVELLDRLPR